MTKNTNPYDPPELPELPESGPESGPEPQGPDEGYYARECFGWISLLIVIFYLVDTIVQIMRRDNWKFM